MSCSGYFERLLRQVEEQSFNNQILQEIQQLKEKLQRKITDLRVQGDHHEANRAEETVTYLERVEKCMIRVLGNDKHES